MASLEKEIEAILVDCCGEEEERAAWEVAFTGGVAVPFSASLLGMPVEVTSPASGRNEHSSRATTLRGRFQLPPGHKHPASARTRPNISRK